MNIYYRYIRKKRKKIQSFNLKLETNGVAEKKCMSTL